MWTTIIYYSGRNMIQELSSDNSWRPQWFPSLASQICLSVSGSVMDVLYDPEVLIRKQGRIDVYRIIRGEVDIGWIGTVAGLADSIIEQTLNRWDAISALGRYNQNTHKQAHPHIAHVPTHVTCIHNYTFVQRTHVACVPMYVLCAQTHIPTHIHHQALTNYNTVNT